MDETKRTYSHNEVREIAEARMKARHDEATRLDAAFRRGFEQGKEEAKEERVKAIACRILENGMDRETVSKLTGLPADKLP